MSRYLLQVTRQLGWLSLFASSSTLICCALPILLVTLGLGASVAALTNAWPFLIFLSLHKLWIFALSGLLLGLTGWLIYRPNGTCPIAPESARVCQRLQGWNQRIFWLSITLWGLGFFAAFIALPLRMFLAG